MDDEDADEDDVQKMITRTPAREPMLTFIVVFYVAKNENGQIVN